MSKQDTSRDPRPEPGKSNNGRKPYRKPEVLSSEHMEIIAAVCVAPGKANPGACPAGPINS